MSVPGSVVALGVVTGMTYGLLAVGLVLAYRGNRVINFAHGNTGSLAAAVMGRLTINYGLPWLVCFPFAIAAGAGASGLLEMSVIRRLRRAPRIMSVVATLGAGQILVGLAGAITHIRNTSLFPPPFHASLSIGALVLTPYYLLILIFSPVIVLAAALFLHPPSWLPRRLRSRYGVAIRAASDNADAARLAGVSAAAMSTLAWTIAGGLSAFSGILLAPSRGFQAIDNLGPSLLVRALAPAVLAGMSSLPIALIGGVVVGVVEQVVLWNWPSGGITEGVIFVIIIVALLVRRSSQDHDEPANWHAIPVARALNERLAAVWSIRNLGRIVGGAVLVVVVLLPLVISNATSTTFISIFILGIIGLSVTVITGMGGQISLGQFAIGAVGALASYTFFVRHDVAWLQSVGLAALVAAGVSIVVGLPALRLRGLMLAVTSIAFAVMVPGTILDRPWAFGTGVDPGRPVVAGHTLVRGKVVYYVVLAGLMVALWLVHNVQRGGIARSLHAIRDNEDAARAFGLPVTMRKLQAFGLAGFIAGLGGALFAHVLSRVTLDSFPPERSVAVVVMTVVGGIANLSGAVLGAAYLVGLPKIIRIDAAEVLVSGAGVLVLVMYVPGGLSQLVQPVRNRIIAFLAKRAGVSPDDDDDQPETTPRYVAALSSNGDGAWRAAEIEFVAADGYAFAARPPAPPLLRGEELVVSYGGVRALDGMTIDVFEGETLGIIGPNGSGKTTLFKAIAGFVSPDAGRVWLGGRDVSSLSPEHRAQLGLVRSFQDAKLFPTLSVLDSVRLACEREEFTSFASSLLGFPGARALERRKDQRARELVSLLGLDRFRHKLVGELSTGTRRIAEMCCLLALEPTVLLLDEPSSGIAQRETEALGELLVRIKRILRATVVVIEHDMPLVMGISDRVVAMESGRVVTVAPPHVVQRHEAVVSSYLGMVVQ